MEREVPGGVPRVLPLVGHRDDVAGVEVAPRPRCARRVRSGGGVGCAGIALEPVLARRSRRTASSTAARRRPGARRSARRRRSVGQSSRRRTRPPRATALLEDARRTPAPNAGARAPGAAASRRRSDRAAPRGHRRRASGRRPSCPPGPCGPPAAGPDTTWSWNASLTSGVAVRCAEEARHVRLVLREQELGGPPVRARVDVEAVRGEAEVRRRDEARRRRGGSSAAARTPLRRPAPRPRVAEPERAEDVERRVLGRVVLERQAHEQVVGPGLGVLDDHVHVAPAVEDARVGELELGVAPGRALPVLLHEPRRRGTPRAGSGTRPSCTRASGVASRYQYASFTSSPWLPSPLVRPKRRSLRIRVLPVPQREGEAEAALAVADAEEAVLAPAVGAAAGVVVREVVPGRRRPRCSPRGRCPTAAPRGTGPQRDHGVSSRSSSSRRCCSGFVAGHRLALRAGSDRRGSVARGTRRRKGRGGRATAWGARPADRGSRAGAGPIHSPTT